MKSYLFFMLFISLQAQAVNLKTACQNSYPKFYMDEKGTMKGICFEIMKAVDKELKNTKIACRGNRFLPFKRIQTMLEDGELDLFFCMAKNSEREKKYIFSELPLYELNHIIALRKDDPIENKSIKSLDDLEGQGVILTNSNTATARLLKKNKKLVVATAKTLEMNINKMLNKRGRFIYFHDIGLCSTIKDKFKNKNIKLLNRSFNKYFHYLAFSKKLDLEIVVAVNRAVAKIIRSGRLKEIVGDYNYQNCRF